MASFHIEMMIGAMLKQLCLLGTFLVLALQVPAQCSSLYTTPEFPIATHPSDGHTQSWGTNLFTAAQMGPAASFTGIQVYVDNSYGPTTYANQTVWLRHSAVSSYPNATYPTTAGFTQCFTGTYSFPMSGLYTISFNVAPFAYNGSNNVEILFENRSNVYRANEPWFRRTTSYGAGVYRSKWNGNFGFGGFPGTASDGSAVRLTYTLSLTAAGGSGCGAMLPTKTVDFAAVGVARDRVRCNWTLTEAFPGGKLILERSAGDTTFATVATWDAPAAGDFSFEDRHPASASNIYRLRTIDGDGLQSLSEMVLVDLSQLDALHCRAAKRLDGGIDLVATVAEDCAAHITVTDLAGRQLLDLQQALEVGDNHVYLPLAQQTGIVILHVAAGGQQWVQKLGLL